MKYKLNSVHWLLLLSLLFSSNFIISLALHWSQISPLSTPADGNVMGKDYKPFWLAGRLAVKGLYEKIYAPAEFRIFLKANFSVRQNFQLIYPPTYLLILYPFAELPYLASYYVFVSFSIIFLILMLCGKTKLKAVTLITVILSPAFLYCLFFGQNGIFFSALFFCGFFYYDKKRLLSAFCIATLLVCKPQLSFLIPVYFMIKKEWRLIAYIILFAIVFVVISVCCMGFQIWQFYFDNIIFQFAGNMVSGDTVIITFYTALSAITGSKIIYAVIASINLILAINFWRKNSNVAHNFFVTALLTLIISPYYLPYDLVFVSLAGSYLLQTSEARNSVFISGWTIWLVPIVLIHATSYFTTGDIAYLWLYAAYICFAAVITFYFFNKADEKDSHIGR